MPQRAEQTLPLSGDGACVQVRAHLEGTVLGVLRGRTAVAVRLRGMRRTPGASAGHSSSTLGTA